MMQEAAVEIEVQMPYLALESVLKEFRIESFLGNF